MTDGLAKLPGRHRLTIVFWQLNAIFLLALLTFALR